MRPRARLALLATIGQDRDGRSRQAAYNLILGALEGVQRRGAGR